MKKYRKIPSFFLLLALAGGFFLFSANLKASFLQNTVGWIWGGMDQTGGGNTGLGWISLNSRDCDDDGNGTVDASEAAASPGCPAGVIVDYGVNVPESGDGPVTGYAWTENYGWVSFNADDVAGCPSGTCAPRREGNRLAGWVRILSIRDAGANAGGWTGFVKLSSDATDTVSYGVTISGQNFGGYAYSDEIGWIDFTGARISPPKKLWVCRDSCSSSQPRGEAGNPMSLLMSRGNSQSLVACFTDTDECSDSSPTANDVTAGSTWTESAGNPTVSLTPDAGKRRLDALSTGNESISASYNGQTANMNVTVTCVENVCQPSEDDQVCAGEAYTIPSFCGQPDLTCIGVRTCNDNWTEVAP